ncbi:uncharacterized protein LOC126744487 [Anthonomus grandis grandis]|uniref:uncharacterized protein LOC126744487 n=1 Tax=Anthonomus grandis grandis TaxID=2921223 RepID=UPI0021664CAD|nr:uncharacterized protein LOC126744487 [Anthonomus grandis grandis]
MRNVEIKAKVRDLQQLLSQAEKLAAAEATIIKQHDTFYTAPNGRLKLRRFPDSGSGELIFYDRENKPGPKLCNFEKVDVAAESVDGLHNVLTKALGAKEDLKKTRRLFLVDQTRIHVDEVASLGNFMELEVCLRPDQTVKDGEKIAHDLMVKLGISPKDLITMAYVDLLSNA